MIEIGRYPDSREGFIGVYAGRKTPLGNPFKMRENCKHTQAERDRVCDLYEKHFHKEIKDKKSELRAAVIELYRLAKSGKNILLLCNCHPNRCHTETIKKFLEEQLSKEQ